MIYNMLHGLYHKKLLEEFMDFVFLKINILHILYTYARINIKKTKYQFKNILKNKYKNAFIHV